MEKIKLNNQNLKLIKGNLENIKYDRANITPGIVHMSVGNFHRAHEEMYLNTLFNIEGKSNFGVIGVGLLPNDKEICTDLKSQDCLYTLLERENEKVNVKIIGAMLDIIHAPSEPKRVLEALTSKDTKIVSLTVTEKGYPYNQVTESFESNHPDIIYALENPHNPKTMVGFIIEALSIRKEKGIGAFTVLSCDNIPQNGKIAQEIIVSAAKLRDKDLSSWIEKNVTFPCTMVDRITPMVSEATIKYVNDELGIIDKRPVMSEQFMQWIIEDNFCAGRPNLEKVGAQFVPQAKPYEEMKMRLLNSSHSALAYIGHLAGMKYVDEATNDPTENIFIKKYMEEVTPSVPQVKGIDINEYKATLIRRFGNPAIRDTLDRICLDGSAKMPKFMFGALREVLSMGKSSKLFAFAIASWIRYCTGVDEKGEKYQINDPMADILIKKATIAGKDPLKFLDIEEVFGLDIPNNSTFVHQVKEALEYIYDKGARAALEKYSKI